MMQLKKIEHPIELYIIIFPLLVEWEAAAAQSFPLLQLFIYARLFAYTCLHAPFSSGAVNDLWSLN